MRIITVLCPCCQTQFKQTIPDPTEARIADYVLGEGQWDVNEIQDRGQEPPPCTDPPSEGMSVFGEDEQD